MKHRKKYGGYYFLWAFIILSIACGGVSRKSHAVKRVPQHFAVMGDSRQFDSGLGSYGGFVNYILRSPEQFPLFAATKFTFSDNDPRTTHNEQGSDLYSSKSCRPPDAYKNFFRVLEAPHDGVIFNLGVNNAGEVARTIDLFQKMYLAAKARGWMVVVMTISPWKGYVSWSPLNQGNTEAINNWILSKPEGVDLVIDTYSLLEDPDWPGCLRPEYTGDKLHLTGKAHAAVAHELHRRMMEYFKK